MVQVAQPSQPEQKFVTDGSHVYHYNEHLAELVARGDLKYCEYPKEPARRKPQVTVPLDEPVMEEVQEQLAGGMKDVDEDDNGKPTS
jgi:hypothetical protein